MRSTESFKCGISCCHVPSLRYWVEIQIDTHEISMIILIFTIKNIPFVQDGPLLYKIRKRSITLKLVPKKKPILPEMHWTRVCYLSQAPMSKNLITKLKNLKKCVWTHLDTQNGVPSYGLTSVSKVQLFHSKWVHFKTRKILTTKVTNKLYAMNQVWILYLDL